MRDFLDDIVGVILLTLIALSAIVALLIFILVAFISDLFSKEE